jgi:Mrp family chromosome partitioning ATPase
MNVPDGITRTFDGLASRVDSMGLRSIGFTSALVGEGVSTIALGTALSLVRLRAEPVLLVDANWLQPSLTADADLTSAPGLADCLARKAEIGAAVRPVAYPGLSFLPAGDRVAARPTLRAITGLLNDVSVLGTDGAHPTIVVDLPPLLEGEPFVLPWAAVLDQVFVVLREAATPLQLARQALEKLGPATPQIVLNRATTPATVVRGSLLAARA